MVLRRILARISASSINPAWVPLALAAADSAGASRNARRRRWRAVAVVVTIAALLTLAAPHMTTADVSVYDNAGNQMRMLHGNSQIYLNVPVYIELPRGQQSSSMPTVADGTVYQYTWDTAGYGHLYAISLSNVNYTQIVRHSGSTPYVLTHATYAMPPITFNAGFTPGGSNAAQGRDSLSTGPYATDGAPYATTYQAIAVGQRLYTWSAGSYPQTGSPPKGQLIQGNPASTDSSVDESPLITPPVTVSGLDASGGQTTWSSPVAVVGSRSGGLIAWPTYVPPGYSPRAQRYATSQDYVHSVATLTSDPTWIGACSVGVACVAFGVAGAHPRVILFNVTNSRWRAIGAGQIGAPITTPLLYDSTGSNNLIVQDEYGKIYSFSLSGQLLGTYSGGIPGGGTDPSWVNSSKPITGKDMSVLTDSTGQTLWAIGDGGGLFSALNPATLVPLSDPTSQFGPGVDSPTSMVDMNGHPTVVVSNAEGNIYLYGTGSIFTGAGGGTYNQAISTPPGTADVSFEPSGGANAWLIGWTNSDPHGLPALIAFVSEPYTAAAAVPKAEVPSGSRVTITAQPSPAGVTYDNGFNNNGPDGKSPVEAQIENAQGQAIGNVIQLHWRGTDRWSGTWTAPANTTGLPVTYKAVVTAWSETAAKAQSGPVSFTVVVPAPTGEQSRNLPASRMQAASRTR